MVYERHHTLCSLKYGWSVMSLSCFRRVLKTTTATSSTGRPGPVGEKFEKFSNCHRLLIYRKRPKIGLDASFRSTEEVLDSLCLSCAERAPSCSQEKPTLSRSTGQELRLWSPTGWVTAWNIICCWRKNGDREFVLVGSSTTSFESWRRPGSSSRVPGSRGSL